MHVTVGQRDQGARDAAPRPEDGVRIGAAGAGHGLALEGDSLGFGDGLEAGEDLRMIAAAAREGRTAAEPHVAVLRFADRRAIGGVSHIHDHGHVGFEGIGDLADAQQADLLLHVGDGADLRREFGFLFFEQPQGLSHGKRANAIVEGARDDQVVAQHVELIAQRDRVADLHQLLGLLAVAGPDVR